MQTPTRMKTSSSTKTKGATVAATAAAAAAESGIVSLRHSFHDRAVYSLAIPGQGRKQCYVSGGYDKYLRLVDVRSSKVISSLKGHKGLISSVTFDQTGNLIVSGSADCSVRLWDALSGTCTRTIGSNLGEISSVSISGNNVYVLSSSKDNSLRLWDVRRTGCCVRRYTGSQNTWKNFIKSCFGPGDDVIVSGSEDGCVYMWDRESGQLIQRLNAVHDDIVYDVKWNNAAGLLATCSHDGTVRTFEDDDGSLTQQ
mmetsp:Transcript_30715/g.51990  ORF Transcript_30715/g.51990 Transcript_30715/m.51990 type:complete len:255 (-) Transcript_30715:130-894(-)